MLFLSFFSPTFFYIRTTASLYSDPSWSKEGLDKVIESSQKELSKSKTSLFSPEQLYYYRSELQNREKEGHSVSIIDTWGLIIEHLIFGKVSFSAGTVIQ